MNPKLVVWGMRYLPYPIKNRILLRLAQIIFPSVFIGLWFVQAATYQAMTGIGVLKNDIYFLLVTAIEDIVGMALILRVAYEYRNREREAKSRSACQTECGVGAVNPGRPQLARIIAQGLGGIAAFFGLVSTARWTHFAYMMIVAVLLFGTAVIIDVVRRR